MGDDGNRSGFVRVTTPGEDALSEPTFIVKLGDIYYVTLSVWEYDIHKATGEQVEGCKQVEKYFNRAHDLQKAPAVAVEGGNTILMCATCRPRRPNGVPTAPPGIKPPRPPADSEKG